MNETKHKIVALVGHCGPDSTFLRMAVTGSAPGTRVVMMDDEQELNQAVEAGDVELFMLNRKLGWGFEDEDGIGLLRRIKARRPEQKVMMISNYSDAQQAAESAGAVPGFGKREIGTPRVKELIASALAGEVEKV